MLAGADLGGDDLAGPFHQWMVLARIIFPAAIEEVEPVQDLAAELDRIDRAALVPIARGELGVPAYAVDDDAPPDDAEAERCDAVVRRLGHDPGVGRVAAIGQRQGNLDYPYVEGLRLDEATNELAFMATGIYGKPIPNQNGAPLRLVTPWKYGFKGIKSIVQIEFTSRMPENTWAVMNGQEYGFYANVNPHVDHPRWSQASERVIGAGVFGGRQPTLMFNGYEKQVGALYKGLDLVRNY